MNPGKKRILLLIAFMLPFILILLFEFGSRNVYEVPFLYEKGIVNHPEECAYNYKTPYILPDSVLDKLEEANNSRLVIISFDTASREVMQNLNRVREQFKKDNVLIREDAGRSPILNALRKCVFLVRGDSTMVLIDDTGRIRGYYNGSKREDVDRLLDEVTIVLKKY